ncbi:TPA: hypothetical protein IRQ32_003918 [Escherichia coli]|nr:hypothetical protein [Escherichia coli]
MLTGAFLCLHRSGMPEADSLKHPRQFYRNKLLFSISPFTCLISGYTHLSHNTKGTNMTVHGISTDSIVNLREKDGKWHVVNILNDGVIFVLKNADTGEEIKASLQDIETPNK